MTTTTKKAISGNDQEFEKSMGNYRKHIDSYGAFTTDELETMRKFFDINQEAQELSCEADSIKAEIAGIEAQIIDARGKYAALIAEGHTAKAMEAVEAIPSLRKRQDALRSGLPSIAARLDEFEKAVDSIDHSQYLERAKEAATAAEQARCRAMVIFGKPSDVRRSIADAREKVKQS